MDTTVVEPHIKFYSYDKILELNQSDNPSFIGKKDIYFTTRYLNYKQFFHMNRLFDEEYKDCKFVIEGSEKKSRITLHLEKDDNDNDVYNIINIDELDPYKRKWIYNNIIPSGNGNKDDTIGKLTIIFPDKSQKEYSKMEPNGYEREWNNIGGRKASVKKEICGKLRCIYKIQGSRKEHIKYKGSLITVADYKKLMKKA
jgi:hypothetical protein